MDLVDLVIFKTVVDEGGIVRAAGKLHRVQSSVTTRIKQLEQSLGTQLFLRARQRLQLTPDGEVLLSYANRLLGLAEEARASVGNGTLAGTLRLGALESTTASRLPTLLTQYHALHPEVRIELVTGTNDALVRMLTERVVDAAFVAETPSGEDIGHVPAFSERLVLVSSLSHRAIAGPKEVRGDTVIAFPTGCAYRRVFERWLGGRGLVSVRVLELSSYHAILACVASGTGVAIVPESVLETVQSGLIARHRLPQVFSGKRTAFEILAGICLMRHEVVFRLLFNAVTGKQEHNKVTWPGGFANIRDRFQYGWSSGLFVGKDNTLSFTESIFGTYAVLSERCIHIVCVFGGCGEVECRLHVFIDSHTQTKQDRLMSE